MSGDYIAQLLALATGRAAVVEPRGKQRFEPENGLADPFAGGMTEDIVTAPPSPPVAQVPPVWRAPATPPTMQEERPATPRAQSTAAQAQEERSISPLFAAPTILPAAELPSATDESPTRGHAPTPASRPAEVTPTPAEQVPAPPYKRQHLPQSAAIQPRAALQPAAPAASRSMPSPPALSPRIVLPPALAAPAAEPPAITIRIDRIDIHAAAPPAPPRSAPAPGTAAPTDLATYLARRREGGW